MADEQLLQGVTSVPQLANMESELEQALERVRARKVDDLIHMLTSSKGFVTDRFFSLKCCLTFDIVFVI